MMMPTKSDDWMAGMTDFQRETFAGMQSRAESCEARFESLHLDEIDWKAERKRLRAELAAANAQLVAVTDELVAMSKMCAAVTMIMEEMQRDEAQRDAERYRWLKSAGCYWVEIQSQPHGDYIFKGQAAHSLGGSIDNAIDAMLAAMRKQGGGS
jgi:multidrug resistance efflux pump